MEHKNFSCNKCGSTNVFTKENETQTGLYCKDCGRWIKWLNKNEKRMFEQIKTEPQTLKEDSIIDDLNNDAVIHSLKILASRPDRVIEQTLYKAGIKMVSSDDTDIYVLLDNIRRRYNMKNPNGFRY